MNNIAGFLGICRRANKLSFGFRAVKYSAESKRAKLLAYAKDSSEKTIKECRYLSEKYCIPLLCLPCSKQQLSEVFSKDVAVVAIEDNSFAKGLNQKRTKGGEHYD